ncbi:MAG: phospho-N-acetylmuramoyl-pentapeptide-transferase [Planctomycetes bacterium]|nr:phospho-N-acetylmuramoyl-pentapeptide-transferase [Planctomycetota bacterium]
MLYNLLQYTDEWLDSIGLFSVLQVLYQLEFRAFFAVLFSFLIVLVFGKPTIRWLIKQKVGDQPEFYHSDVNELMASKAATPTMGGILICSSIFLTIALFADLRNSYVHLSLIVLGWLAVVGGFDDWLKLTSATRKPGSREGLYAWEKLLFQLGIGAVAGFFLYRNTFDNDVAHVLVLPLQRTYVPNAESLVLEEGVIVLGFAAFMIIATLLIAGTSNAVNLTDGMDGLATGCVAICALVFVILTHIVGTEELAAKLLFLHVPNSAELVIPCGAMFGACLGFLWYNCHPAHVFMGDTGSLPLGGIIGFVAIVTRQELMLFIVGGVFVMEALSVIAQVGYFKWTKGSRIFRCAPIHHHFQELGWSEPKIVMRAWLISAIGVIVGLILFLLDKGWY